MAKRTIVSCDVCGSDAEPAYKFRVAITGDNSWSGDLCTSCKDKLKEQFPGSESSGSSRNRTFDTIRNLDA